MELFSLNGYGHFYRSLLRFCSIDSYAAKELTYLLNTANIDSFHYQKPGFKLKESSPFAFFQFLDAYKRPYRTEVQLYKAMLTLYENTRFDHITNQEREAIQKLQCIMGEIQFRFYKAYGMDIKDPRTVYAECVGHLEPKEDEPAVCIMAEWLTLPSA